MAISKAKKGEILAVLEAHLKASTSVAFTSNTGMTALDVTTMKKELRVQDTTFMLAKKTLMRLAFKNVFNIELDIDTLPGQVAIIISKGDKVAGLAVVNKYAKEWAKEQKMKFVGGFFDGVLLDAKAISRIAGLPSREVLLAKLLGSMMSPVSGLARFFDGAKKDMEAKGLKTAKDLIGSAATTTVAEVVAAAPVVAEVTPEAVAEAPAPEATVEAPAEAVAEVAPEATEETIA
ncbi:MAG: 50S ribosomal protein L10 [Candidatus Gracilibacteria bacterium]|nr:50S ribosomal protein L10 [Candidatus Gracilibacteria bacterium]